MAPVERPALLMIDVQREYFTRESPLRIPDGPAVLDRLSGLLEEARARGVGVVHVQHHGDPGSSRGTPAVERWRKWRPQRRARDRQAPARLVRRHERDEVLAGSPGSRS
jgi:nicotinamidase-related amidase